MYTTNKEVRKSFFSDRGFSRFVILGILLLFFGHSFAQQPIPANLPDSATGNPNSSVLLPITIGDITGRNVRGYSAFVQYDNSVLRATGVDVTNTLSEALPPLTIEITDVGSSGIISMKAQGSTALSGSGVWVNLNFDVIGSPADTTLLVLDFFFNEGSPPAETFNGKFTVNSPNIEVSPLSLDFGFTFPDSAVERTVQVANTGTYQLAINNISLSGENANSFSLVSFTSPVIIPTGEVRQVPIQFAPGNIGTKNAFLNIDSDDPDEPRVTVDLFGEAMIRPEPDILLSASVIDFGEIVENTVEVRQLEIKNVGTAILEISEILIENDNQSDFSIAGNQVPFLIEPDDSTSVDLTFSPSSPGASESTMVILSNDPDENRSEVALFGLATPQPAPEILVIVDSLRFEGIRVDSTNTQSLTIRNIGSDVLVISELNLSGPDASEFEVEGLTLPLIIQQQDSESIELSFSPQSIGLKSAFLEIVSNDAKTPSLSIPIDGVGKEESNISLDISSIKFDDVFSDSAKSAFFTIKNSGNADLEILSIETTGRNPGDFLIENVAPPFTLIPEDSQEVAVVFSPLISGERSAFIEIRTNDPNNALISIPVSGTSLPPLVPKVFVSSDTLTFGTLEIEADSTIVFYIGNLGDANLRIDGMTIKNQNIPDFLFVAPELPFEVSPGDSQKIEVIFRPNRDGPKNATLEILSNDPKKPLIEVILQGNGVFSFIFMTNVITPNNSFTCGDSAVIEVEFFMAGGVAPIEIVCTINDMEFIVSGQKLAVTIPVFSDSFLVEVECIAKDGLDRMRSGRDSIVVLNAPALVCSTTIVSPPNNGITILDSINVLVEHETSGGISPISSECRINGISAIKQDSLFFAKIPLVLGENLITAICLAEDDCGFKAICSDSIFVTRISETVCEVEIISPENDGLVCDGDVTIKARVKIPDFVGIVNLTTMIGEEVVPISEDSLFSSEILLQSGRNLIVAKAIVEFENGLTLECVDSVYVSFDDIIPECNFWSDAGKIVGVLTDSLSGLANIEILQIINAQLVIDEFQPGAKQIQFQVLPKNPEKSIVFNMQVTDVCGNSVICDPVYINLFIDNSSNYHVIDFLYIDRFFTVKNNGIEMIRCKLNQKEFILFTEQIAGRPKPNSYQISKYGETRFDLSSELKAGNNLLEVQLIGYPGASVELFLADQTNGAMDYNLEINAAPQEFTLRPNYPNPFNPSTNIEFEVPVKYTQGVRVEVQVYNILGEVVNNLMDEFKQPGIYRLAWDGTNNNGLKLSSGIYILNMQADSFSMQRRMLLVK